MRATVCVVVVLIAVSVGDEETRCTLEVPEDKTMTNVLNEKLEEDCSSFSLAFYNECSLANTSADFRLAAKRFCDNQPSNVPCAEAVRTEAQVCLEGVNRTKFLLYLEFVKTSSEVSCIRDGERMATLEEEMRKTQNFAPKGDTDINSQCILQSLRANKKKASTSESNQDPNEDMKMEYRILKDARACLEGYRGQGYELFVDAGVGHMSDIMDRMRCVDSQNGAYILCKSIIDN